MRTKAHQSKGEFQLSITADQRAFTLIELIAVIAIVILCAILVLPAVARTRTHGSAAQCLNNLKQLAGAWAMYSADNRGSLVSAYPSYGGFQGSWCKGNAASSGQPGAYGYGGADPRGITNGLLWPYIKTFSAYKCAEDNRVALAGSPFPGQPMLRSVSMNSFMAGTSFGITPTFTINGGGVRNPNAPVFLKENEISRPATTWVILEEDPMSINEGMLLMDIGGTRRFLDLPSRLHPSGYGINFADGHVEAIKFEDSASLNWTVSGTGPRGGLYDWQRLTNLTTTPLN